MPSFDKMMEELDKVMETTSEEEASELENELGEELDSLEASDDSDDSEGSEDDSEGEALEEKFMPHPDGYNVKLYKKDEYWHWAVYDPTGLADKGKEKTFEKACKALKDALVSAAP